MMTSRGRTGEDVHGKHGWFKPGKRSYARLLESDAVQLLAKTFSDKDRPGRLYQFQHFLEINKLDPDEALGLSEAEVKKCVKRACLTKQQEDHYAAARNLFYIVRRFFELNGKEIRFNRTEKKMLLKRKPKKIAKQHIPTREEIYRMADAFPNRNSRQHTRGKAMILSLWQSGVRSSCLCSWVYGMFKDQLWPQVKIPVTIKVVANRPDGVTDCAEDTKLSSYNVGYYYTFLHEEAALALRDYLNERIADGWQPEDSNPVFVTEASMTKGDPIDAQHVIGVVKTAAEQVGIDPDSIWTHCLRKAFRKTLYRGGVDPDCAEGLMGHKLPGSKGSYFDYHDASFVADEYMRGFWQRIGIDRIRGLEDEIGELRKEREKRQQLETKITELKQRLNGLTKPKKTIDTTMTQLLEDPEVQEVLKKKLKDIL